MLLVIAGIGAATGNHDANLPNDQKHFLKAVGDVAAAHKSANSDLQRKLAADAAIGRWCAALPSTTVTEWVGKVQSVDNSIGQATLRIQISDAAEVRTSSSFLGDTDTLIAKDSNLFKQVSKLSVGQQVRFSGHFVAGSSGACLRETSLTDSGTTESPDFLFKFTAAQPA